MKKDDLILVYTIDVKGMKPVSEFSDTKDTKRFEFNVDSNSISFVKVE